MSGRSYNRHRIALKLRQNRCPVGLRTACRSSRRNRDGGRDDRSPKTRRIAFKRGKTPLENAGLADFFERQFSIETARAYKPAQVLYHMVAQELEVPHSACCMVAAHVWDTIGAQSAGLAAGLITRPGNAPLLMPGLPQPNVVAPDLPELAAKMIELWRS